MRMLGVEIRQQTAGRCYRHRVGTILSVFLGLAAIPVAAQAADETDRAVASPPPPAVDAAPPSALAADGQDYVIPFMVLTDIETDFSLVPPSSNEIIRDASIESIDALFEVRQAKN